MFCPLAGTKYPFFRLQLMDYEWLINLIFFNILVFVHLELFEEFANVTAVKAVPSTTLSLKLLLMLVISNGFLFCVQVDFVTSISERYWALNISLLVKYSMNFVSDLHWYQILSPLQRMVISWYFHPNKYMGLLSLEVN